MTQMVTNPPAMQETWIWFLGREDPLQKGMTNHSSILAWRIPQTEESDGLQSMESQCWTQLRNEHTLVIFGFILLNVQTKNCFVVESELFSIFLVLAMYKRKTAKPLVLSVGCVSTGTVYENPTIVLSYWHKAPTYTMPGPRLANCGHNKYMLICWKN